MLPSLIRLEEVDLRFWIPMCIWNENYIFTTRLVFISVWKSKVECRNKNWFIINHIIPIKIKGMG